MTPLQLWVIVLGFLLLLATIWTAIGAVPAALARLRDRITFVYWVLRFAARVALADSIREHPSGRTRD